MRRRRGDTASRAGAKRHGRRRTSPTRWRMHFDIHPIGSKPMHRAALCLATALALAAATSARAQEAPAEWSVSGNLALTSDYLFRGLSQSSQDPALQGGIEAAHS